MKLGNNPEVKIKIYKERKLTEKGTQQPKEFF